MRLTKVQNSVPRVPASPASADSVAAAVNSGGALSLPPLLVDVAEKCRCVIARAESDGLTIDDGNVIDLLADNISPRVSLSDLRCALVVAGFAARFPRATSPRAQS